MGPAAVPFDLVFSADGAQLYVCDAATGEIRVFRHDGATHTLTPIQVAAAGPSCSPREAILSVDQRHLYVACPAVDSVTGAISVFARDPASGLLSFASSVASQRTPRGLAISPGGVHVYAAGTDGGDASLKTFTRDWATGALTPVATGRGYFRDLDGIAVARNGFDVYTLSNHRTVLFDPIRIFVDGIVSRSVRDLTTGLLRNKGSIAGDGLNGTPSAIGLAPDNDDFYVTGDGFLAALSPTTVGIGRKNHQLEGRGGVSGLARSTALAVTQSAVYVVAPNEDNTDGTIALFRRLPSGSTAFIEAVSGVEAPFAVVASPDGERIFVAAATSRSIEVYREERVCTDAPRTDCHPPTRASLSISTKPTGRVIRYLWQNEATPFALGGDPIGGSTYSLCVYEESSGSPALGLDLDAPQGRWSSGRGWKRTAEGTVVSRYRYSDRSRVPDGVSSVVLEPQKVRFSARGVPAGSNPFEAPLTVQVTTDFGECWTSHFDTDDVRVSDPSRGRFAALSRTP